LNKESSTVLPSISVTDPRSYRFGDDIWAAGDTMPSAPRLRLQCLMVIRAVPMLGHPIHTHPHSSTLARTF
jgi:hypothetical protein